MKNRWTSPKRVRQRGLAIHRWQSRLLHRQLSDAVIVYRLTLPERSK